MRRVRQASLLAVVAMGSFVWAYTVRHSRRASEERQGPVALPATISDSLRIARLGFVPGRQLVVFVFGSGRCRSCRSETAKLAIANLQRTLGSRREGVYDAVKLIGVAVHTDFREALDYLESIGLSNFDEVSFGGGWQNEHIERWIWRDSTAEASMPQVIIVTRTMSASLDPVALHYGPDSVVKVLIGLNAITQFVNAGAPIPDDASHPSVVGRESLSLVGNSSRTTQR